MFPLLVSSLLACSSAPTEFEVLSNSPGFDCYEGENVPAVFQQYTGHPLTDLPTRWAVETTAAVAVEPGATGTSGDAPAEAAPSASALSWTTDLERTDQLCVTYQDGAFGENAGSRTFNEIWMPSRTSWSLDALDLTGQDWPTSVLVELAGTGDQTVATGAVTLFSRRAPEGSGVERFLPRGDYEQLLGVETRFDDLTSPRLVGGAATLLLAGELSVDLSGWSVATW